MKRFVFALVVCLTAPFALYAQGQAAPEIPFDSVPNFLKLPPDIYLGETAGVAVNSKGHIFVFTRANSTGPAYGASAAQLLEFGPDGSYLREIGHNLYAWSYAHAVRVDKEDNIWVTDKGSDMVIKFDPAGRVVMVFGRKQEASDESTGPLKHVHPPLPPVDGQFRQVTDVTWDPAGNTYISDGYINSRVAKVDKNGKWLKSFGEPGDQPGQFNTPHSIAADAQGNIYVADRGNRRIQVFDGDGKFLRQITIDVPFDYASAVAAIGKKPAADATGTQASGSPWAICITPGPQSGDVRLGRVSGTHLQVEPRRQGARRAGRDRQTAQAIWLDSRDRVPIRERALCRRVAELARAETCPASKEINLLQQPNVSLSILKLKIC